MKSAGIALFLAAAGCMQAIAAPCPAATTVASPPSSPPAWDNSGNCLLNGTYYFRYVQYTVGDNSGNLSRAVAVYGNITFLAATGTYSISSSSAQELDSASALPMAATGLWQSVPFSATGTYYISASGQGFLTNPLSSPTTAAGPISPGNVIWVLVDKNLNLIGSSSMTFNSGQNDLFIGAPVSTATNASLAGNYTVDYLNFPDGHPLDTIAMTFQMAANGTTPGSISTSNMTSYSSNPLLVCSMPCGTTGQVNYVFSNNAAALGFPVNPGLTNTGSNGLPGLPNPASTFQDLPGQEFLYISPDNNFIFGGSPGAWDMFVGVRTGTGGVSFPGTFSTPLFIQAGIEEDNSRLSSTPAYGSIDSYFGALTFESGSILDQKRILAPLGSPASPQKGTLCAAGSLCAYNNVSSDNFTQPSSIAFGTVVPGGAGTSGYMSNSTGYAYTIGAYGSIRIGLGAGIGGQKLGINVALPAYSELAPSTSAPWIEPAGVVNAFSYAPFTEGVSPGDIIALFGSNFSTAIASSGVATPDLNGVQVIINGANAALLYVSPDQIDAVVPYGVNTPAVETNPYTPSPIATPITLPVPVTLQTQVTPSIQIQVINSSGTPSNVVTEAVNLTTPALLTTSGTAIGPAFALDFGPTGTASGTQLKSMVCAVPGDQVELFMTGAGGLTPTLSGGTLTYGTAAFTATVGGIAATIAVSPFPSSSGLYSAYITIPAMSLTGEIFAPVVITGPDSVTSGVTLPLAPPNPPSCKQ